MKQNILTILFALTAILVAHAQSTPTRVEYFFDIDPGYGLGKTIEGIQAAENQAQIDLSDALPGAHTLYVRAQDSEGHWSATVSCPFYVKDRLSAIHEQQRLEYYFDTDPGYGQGFSASSPAEGQGVYSMDFSPLSTGAHTLYVRMKDAANRWSTTVSHPLYVCQPRGITQIEYFFDQQDPGQGKATQVTVSNPNAETVTFSLSIENLTVGDHQLCVRGKGQNGLWSFVCSEPFTITSKEDGIKDVLWRMPLSVRLSTVSCMLTDCTAERHGDRIVELTALDGRTLTTASWPANAETLNIPIHTAKGTVLIVRISDIGTGKQSTKRIISQ